MKTISCTQILESVPRTESERLSIDAAVLSTTKPSIIGRESPGALVDRKLQVYARNVFAFRAEIGSFLNQ